MIKKRFHDQIFEILDQSEVEDIISSLDVRQIIEMAIENHCSGWNCRVELDLTYGEISHSLLSAGSTHMYDHYVRIFALDQNFDFDDSDVLIPQELLKTYKALRDRDMCGGAEDFLRKMAEEQRTPGIHRGFRWARLERWEWVETDPTEVWLTELENDCDLMENARSDLENIYENEY